jgi:hypothetical protein
MWFLYTSYLINRRGLSSSQGLPLFGDGLDCLGFWGVEAVFYAVWGVKGDLVRGPLEGGVVFREPGHSQDEGVVWHVGDVKYGVF